MNHHSEDIKLVLCRFYAVAKIGRLDWFDEFCTFAEQQLDKGIFLELYRKALFDPPEELTVNYMEDTLKCDYQIDGLTPNQTQAFFIEHIMLLVISDSSRAIVLGHELRLNFEDIFADDLYHIKQYMTIFYQWWAGDSEWMIGQEFEQTKQRAIIELEQAASDWIEKHTPVLENF